MKLLTIQEGWKDWLKGTQPVVPTRTDRARSEIERQEQARLAARDLRTQRLRDTNSRPQDAEYRNPDQLYRDNDPNATTFVYTQDHQLHLGASPHTPHYELFDQTPELHKGRMGISSPRAELQLEALVGRIAKTGMREVHAVSFWNSPRDLLPLIEPCLQELLKRGLIQPNTQIHHPKIQTDTVQRYLDGRSQEETDPEVERKAELARQLHLMPSDQKRKAMKELGLASHSKPNRWRDEMRKAGIPAGSSHHFGTSEGNMRHFERILNEVLKGWHVGDTEPGKGGFMRGNFGRTKINTADAYKSVKYARTLSDKLSRLTKHDIIILVGNGLQKFVGGPSGRLLKKMDQTHEAALSKMTGIPISDFETSFTVLIIGNQGQPRLSPWLILHQIGECIVQYSGEDFWNDTIFPKYQKYFSKMSPELNISQDTLKRHYSDYNERMWKQYGGVDQYEEEHGQKYRHPYDNPNTSVLAFHNLFKMKSARELIHGEFDNIDPSQEIIVDYLWHGGNIRMNQPEWLDPKVVDAIRRDITTWIDQKLTRLAGYRLVNEPEFVDETDQPGDEFSDHIRDRLG